MARDERTGSRKKPPPKRRKFRDLPKSVQQDRITRAEEAGRLSEEKAAQARRFHGLAPKASDRSAAIWAAQQNQWPPVKPPRAPSQREIDRDRIEHRDLVERATGRTRPRFIAPPPPKKPKDARLISARDYNWALRAPVDAPSRGANLMLRKTMPVERQREIQRSLQPPQTTTEERARAKLGSRFDPGWDWLVDREQRAEVGEYLGELETMSTEAAAATDRLLKGRFVKGRVQKQAQIAGFDEDVAADIATVTTNLVSNLAQGAIGFGPGAVAAMRDPGQAATEIASFYKDFYAPLLQGDLEQFKQNAKQNPDMFLDWFGGFGAITGTVKAGRLAALAARRADQVGATRLGAGLRSIATRKTIQPIRTKEGPVMVWRKPIEGVVRRHRTKAGVETETQRYVPGSAAGQIVTDVYDRLVRRTWKGGRRRRKGIREQEEADRARLNGQVEAFRADTRSIQASAPLSMAFDRMLIRGGSADEVADDLVNEIAERQERGFTETRQQQQEIKVLEQAIEVLRDPPANLLAAVDRGREIANASENTLKRAGLLTDETAERMLLRPAQFLEPAVKVDSPMRNAFIDQMSEVERMDPALVQLATDYLDAHAVAYGRRWGVPPERFYEDLYRDVQAVNNQDINNLFDSGGTIDPDDPPEDVLFQRGDPVPYAISQAKGAESAEARRRLTSEDPVERAEAIAEAQPKGRLGGFVATIQDKLDRITTRITSKQERAQFAAWYRMLWTEFEGHFGPDVREKAVRAFAMTQSNTSPADGIMVLLKMLEYKHLNGHWPEEGIHPRRAEIAAAWDNVWLGEDPKGVAQKISDFYGSIYGAETRAWLQHIDLSAPGVVDRWSYRSDGYVDYAAYAHLRSKDIDAPNPKVYEDLAKEIKAARAREKKEGLSDAEQADLAAKQARAVELKAELDEFYDMAGSGNALQYEYASMRLNELRDLMNSGDGFDGRKDWSVDEVQALDWFATRIEWGEQGGGWPDNWARNTYNVVSEIIGTTVKDFLREGANAALVRSVTVAGSHSRTELVAYEGQAQGMAQRLADETGRPAYVFYDYGVSGTRRAGIDIEAADPKVFDILRGQMQELADRGLYVLPWGNGTVRIMWADANARLPKPKPTRDKRPWSQRKRQGEFRMGVGPTPPAPKGMSADVAIAERDALLAKLEKLGVEARAVNPKMEVKHGSPTPHGSLYRGDDPRGVAARSAASYRRRSDFRVSEVAGVRGARRFVAGLQRNTRAWSLSPRVVDDFVKNDYRGFITDDGNAGSAISPDGEIVSVFNSRSFPDAGGHALIQAIAEGGYWLNAYDGFLPSYYADMGFREVARIPFSEEHAPAGWDYRHGRPDVVFMAYAPHLPVKRTGRYYSGDDWNRAESRAKNLGAKSLQEKTAAEWLEELADLDDVQPHIAKDGAVLTQFRRKVNFVEGDPVVQGLVKITDDGVELTLNRNASNFSTIVHENAHAVLRATLEWLQQGNDPRLESLMRHLGLDTIEDVSDVDKTRAAQELWARLVEVDAYLGRMPATQLRRMDKGVQNAMRDAYRGGRRQIAGELFDKVDEMLKDPDVNSLLDDLIDVTYGVQRRGDAVFMPRIGPMASSKVAHNIRRLTSSITRGAVTPPRRTPVRRGNLGIRFEEGNYAYGPDVVAAYATTTFRHQMREDMARQILADPEAKELTFDAEGNLVVPRGHRLFQYDQVQGASRAFDEELGFQERAEILAAEAGGDVQAASAARWNPDREPQELFEEINDKAREAFKAMSPEQGTLDRGRLADLIAGRKIVWIPESTFEAYLDAVTGTTAMSMAAKQFGRDLGPTAWALAGPLELLNFLQRWNMVGKLAYGVTNTIGSAVTATLHNPFWVGEIKKMSDRTASWEPSSLRRVDEAAGSGSYEIAEMIDPNERGLPGWMRKEREAYRKTAHTLTWAERRIRRMVAIRELRAHGYDTEQKVLDLFELADTDVAARQELNQIMRWAEDAVVRFRGSTPTEQMLIRRGFFVYGWLRASMRYTMRFPLEHPVMAAAMNRVGQEGWDDIQEALEKEIGLRGGLVTKVTKTEEGKVARMIDMSSLLPFFSGLQTVGTLASVIAVPLAEYGGDEVARIGSPADLLSSGPEMGLTLFLGESPGGQSANDLLGGLFGPSKGASGVPGLNWIWRISDPNVTETKTYAKRTRTDVVMSFLLGQLWPRDTKVDPAHESYLKRLPQPVRATIQEQAKLDKLLEVYAGAVGDNVQQEEWKRAANARASYDLGSRLKQGEWNELDDNQREIERARMKAKVIKRFWPGSYTALQTAQRAKGVTAQQMIDLTDDFYYDLVTGQVSEMKEWIKAMRPAQAVDDL